MDQFFVKLIMRLGRTRFLDSTKVFETLGKRLNVDFLKYAHAQRGILKWRSAELSGEHHFMYNVLPQLVPDNAVCFDVGANRGDYTSDLLKVLPSAKITSFEPNPKLRNDLEQRFGESVSIEGVALSASTERRTLYAPKENGGPSEHASLHCGVLKKLHDYQEIESITVDTTSLDDYCDAMDIRNIDFLKIDTEGGEKDVLLGARKLLEARGLPLIQFEFNEMNVESRVFLKDFFEILPNHRFYRLDSDTLLPLSYHPREELFQFQNIVATTVDLPTGLPV